MTTYLLPCECTADVVVTAGQAGGRVTCGRCGRELLVPKLGDLAAMRRQEAVVPAGNPTWRPAQAAAFLGVIVSAGALLATFWIAPRATGVLDERALRAAVLSADDLTVYRVWSEGLSRTGVRRPPADEELMLLRQSRFADGMRGVLHLVAACGAVAAIAAGLRLALASKPVASGGAPGKTAGHVGAYRS
ncbi:MAG: hypothetical protein WCR51_04170 [Planctomycetia bacterium]